LEETRMGTVEDIDRKELELLNEKVSRLLERGDDRAKAKAAEDKSEKQPWYVVTVGIIAIPAAIIGLMVSFGQWEKTGPEQEKTIAETQNLRVDALKKQVELQQILNDVTKNQAANSEYFRTEVTPKIEDTIAALNRLNNAAQTSGLAIIAKFILVYLLYKIFYFVVGLFERVWTLLMQLITELLSYWVSRRLDKVRKQGRSEQEEHLYAIRNRIYKMPAYLQYVPTIAVLTLELIVLLRLVVPLSLETATVIGKSQDVSNLVSEVYRLHFVTAFRTFLGLFN
jgi:hypothetical protein